MGGVRRQGKLVEEARAPATDSEAVGHPTPGKAVTAAMLQYPRRLLLARSRQLRKLRSHGLETYSELLNKRRWR
eukprot:8766488-Pyramimonas_sp.AAC.1